MIKFISKSELDSQKSDKKKTHYVGTIYPQIFSTDKRLEFKENMQLEAGIIWLGGYWLDSNLFPKEGSYCIELKNPLLHPYCVPE